MIFTDKTYTKVIIRRFLTKSTQILAIIFKIISFIPLKIGKLILYCLNKAYFKFKYKADKIKKTILTLLITYAVLILCINAFLYYTKQYINYSSILILIITIIGYVLIRILLYIYIILFGNDYVSATEEIATEDYVVTMLPHLLKIYGHTGAGKDTFMSGCTAILARNFHLKTLREIEELKTLLYIFDFAKLDLELTLHYKSFLSFSKSVIEDNFIGTPSNSGIAIHNNLFLNKEALKKIKPQDLLDDYYKFISDPLMSQSEYTSGVGVNRKHFLELLMENYIEWFIRTNIELNFVMTNQPYVEDFDSGLMSMEFSYHFLKTRHDTLKKLNKSTGKREAVNENVLFPWKDRLIVAETECGTWWTNKESGNYLIESGIRDFKAFQRHFMSDFYWFQTDQAAGRTQALFRELEHGYAGILNRQEIKGNTRRLLWINFKLHMLQKKILKIEKKALKQDVKNTKRLSKLEKLKEMYEVTSSVKYSNLIEELEKKMKPKALPSSYYKYRQKASKLKNELTALVKDGYIVLDVSISTTSGVALSPDYKPIPISQIKEIKSNIVVRLVFKTSDCERYDTRYLKNIAEKQSLSTKLHLAEVRRWSNDFKMKHDDLVWLGYPEVKKLGGISEEEYDDFKYGSLYEKLKREI